MSIRFTKGHGTENDFVLVPDLEARLRLTSQAVRALADRHAGIGGDGVIRVVPTASAGEPEVEALADRAPWFMDYRNADGSLAEMCGNGTRVIAAWLRREGLMGAEGGALATRGGVKPVRFVGEEVATHMGTWRLDHPELARQDGFDALVHVEEAERNDEPYSALSIDMGNPHTVVALPPTIALGGLDLQTAPLVNPDPPRGSNVEFVRLVAPGHIEMRVHERGVGETRSCGTGVCAAAIATAFWSGASLDSGTWRVDVPGGTLSVHLLPGNQVELQGPVKLVADGTTALIGD